MNWVITSEHEGHTFNSEYRSIRPFAVVGNLLAICSNILTSESKALSRPTHRSRLPSESRLSHPTIAPAYRSADRDTAILAFFTPAFHPYQRRVAALTSYTYSLVLPSCSSDSNRNSTQRIKTLYIHLHLSE